MGNDIRRIVLVDTGSVEMSFVYALPNQTTCDELVLIDIGIRHAEGEAMSLNHGVAFSGSHMKVYAGTYSDYKNADTVVICASVAQKPGEIHIDLPQCNMAVFHSVVGPVVDPGFGGIFFITTNPIDIMTHVTQKLSRFDPRRVIGSGITLDSAYLRYLLDSYLRTDLRNVYAYVMGEHGDGEFVSWSQAMVGTEPVLKIVEEPPEKFSPDDLQSISEEIRNTAQKIIAAKKLTYYGIGMSAVRIAKATSDDESSILTASTLLNGEYRESDVYTGVPYSVNRKGTAGALEASLTEKELEKFKLSSGVLRDTFDGIRLEE